VKQNQCRELLYNVLVKTSNVEDMEKLLSSLCSESELDKMAQRLKVAKMFLEGAKYRDIVRETNASTATLAKIKFDLFYGKKGLVNV
jgi:TrpR-related protein YerC/YecD